MITTPDLLIYGGAFDPPHAAHVASAAAALARFPGARLLALPAPTPAGAGGAHKQPTASFADRAALCRLAFATLGPRVEVSEMEADLPPPHYTVRTLAAVHQRWPAANLGFVIGEDQLAAFPKWHQPREILAQAALVVVPRPASEAAGDGEDRLRAASAAIAAALNFQGAWNQEAKALALGGNAHPVFILPAPVGPETSTKLRHLLSRGEAPPRGWLPATVADYIRTRQLYRA
jgi:nicotinate-nucleotide adenylyltransferase